MARRTSAKRAAKAPARSSDGYNAQCAALTADGAQCRNSSRAKSKYCGAHRGYQPPAAKGLAKRIEGDSWSATDRLSDRQSRRNADTRPKVRKAEDTPLAVRGKGTKAAPARASPTRKPARPQAAPLQFEEVAEDGGRPDAGYTATLLQGEQDYLVVFEEPDPDGMPQDDNLVLDVDAGQPVSLGEVNLEQKLDLELANNTNWVGKLGFVLAIIGAIIGIVVLVFFAITYPQEWYDGNGDPAEGSILPGTAFIGVIAILMQLAGVILTHYGRRIQARGNLSRMRIVEKAFQPRVTLGDET